jgi:hypothetical protein
MILGSVNANREAIVQIAVLNDRKQTKGIKIVNNSNYGSTEVLPHGEDSDPQGHQFQLVNSEITRSVRQRVRRPQAESQFPRSVARVSKHWAINRTSSASPSY